MDILMVAAELGPYLRTTEVGETVAGLGKSLAQQGHSVTVALPRRPELEEGGLLMARRLTPLSLEDGTEVTLLDGQLPSGVKLVLFDASQRASHVASLAFPGAAAGAAGAARVTAPLLSLAAAALVRQRAAEGKPYEVAHLHGAEAALTACLLRQGAAVPTATVLSLYEPAAPSAAAPLLRPRGARAEGEPAGFDAVEVTCFGLGCAGAVTVGAPSVVDRLAEWLPGPLREALAERGAPPTGIVGGLDYAVHNPATDSALASRYDAEESSSKGTCKTSLLRELELAYDVDGPLLLCLLPSITEATAASALVECVRAIAQAEATLVMLGDGAPAIVDELARIALEAPRRVVHLSHAEDALRRRLFAGADLLVGAEEQPWSPSALRLAQRYGALPVALAVGAVLDVVVDCDAGLETGTGFLYDAVTAESMLGAIRRGMAAWQGHGWRRLVGRVMRLDSSWDGPARRYLRVYRDARPA